MYSDILIIGAGVVGTALARELSFYNASVRVLDKKFDIADGATKANSGIVHAGYDCKPNSQKAKFNVWGAKMYEQLARSLCVPYKKNGAFVLAFSQEEKATLETLLNQGKANEVEHLAIIDGGKARELEPNLNPKVLWVLHIPTSGIVSPFEMAYALADHAAVNGVRFHFETLVEKLEFKHNLWHIHTNCGVFTSKIIINCAGVHSATMHAMITGHEDYSIQPRKGEYFLLDRENPLPFTRTMFQTPSKMGKGVLVAPTVHGNTLLGPSSIDVDDAEDVSTSAQTLSFVFEKALLTWPKASKRTVITTFAGMRAHEKGGDFIVGKVKNAPSAYETVGIESPGLSAAPAIALHLAQTIAQDFNFTKKDHIIPFPKRKPYFIDMSMEEKEQAILENPDYAKMVCRCEQVTEAEIREAIRRPVGARCVDAVKRRCRAGGGRCQGGFCSPRIIEILAEEMHVSPCNISKCTEKSKCFVGLLEDFAIKEAHPCK